MAHKGYVAAGAVLLLAVAWALPLWAAGGDAVPRMAGEELKAQLGAPAVAVLDVRANADWRQSAQKIAGAVREAPGEVRTWARKYPRDKTIVLYCA